MKTNAKQQPQRRWEICLNAVEGILSSWSISQAKVATDNVTKLCSTLMRSASDGKHYTTTR